jgi:hypothetical protein
MSDDKTADVFGGRFYQREPGGRMREISTPPRPPDAWICRRVDDFPDGILPAGAATTVCSRCGVAIAYNPGRVLTVPIDTPQICMQCAHIEPLPIEP